MIEHLLQSSDWERFERIEEQSVSRISTDKFSALAIVEDTPFGKYLFCPYGPTIHGGNYSSIAEDLNEALLALKEIARQKKAFFVRVEPPFADISAAELKSKFGLKKSHDIEPAHTWILDLTQTEEAIFSEMEKEKGRLWRNCAKKGISIRQTKDPEEVTILSTLLGAVGNSNHFIPQKEIHLKNQMRAGFATLYIAELEGTPIAASLVYDHDGVRYYAHAASDYEHRKLAAGAILLVQMIVDAKRQGLKTFDFWGITTSTDPKHPWYGFTQYKKSFGGKQIDYAGTWDLPVNRLRYLMYCFVRKVNRIRRRISHTIFGRA